MFADVLLIFCKLDMLSFQAIQRFLNEFANSSDLVPNNDKCVVYLVAGPVQHKKGLLDYSKMPEGSLPFRYLGVPLASKKLDIADINLLLIELLQY